jgi:hypothetical protein
MNGLILQEILRILNCMEKTDFEDCWPGSGNYLWSKFIDEKDQDIFEFIVYLDMFNAQKLVNYCMPKIRQAHLENLPALAFMIENFGDKGNVVMELEDFSKCQACGAEIGSIIGQKKEKLCAECYDQSSYKSKSIIRGGNAYRLIGGELEVAAVNKDGSIDQNSWGEIEDFCGFTPELIDSIKDELICLG